VGKPLAIGCGALLAVVVVLGIIGALVGGNGTNTATQTPPETAPAATSPPDEQPAETSPPDTTEAPADTPITVSVGSTITAADAIGRAVAEVTVSRLRFSRGAEFSRPERGRFLLVHVRVEALRDNISAPNLYVLQGGEKFDQTCCVVEVGPEYQSYQSLSKGQFHQGTAIFDVAATHGRIVLPASDETPIGYWTF
jgi:hypothetical protein